MFNFFFKKKIKLAVCISGHLDYKIRGPKRTQDIFEKKIDFKEFLYQEDESGFEQYSPKLGYNHLNELLKSCDKDYFIHSWSYNKKDIINEIYKPKKFLYEKQIFFPFNLKDYNINEHEKIENWNIDDVSKFGYSIWLENRKKENKNYQIEDLLNEIKIQIFRTTSRYYSIKKSTELLLENKLQNEYDFFLICRFGSHFNFFWKPKFHKLDKKKIYAELRKNREDENMALHDHWFISGIENIDVFRKLYDERFNYCTRPPFAFRQHIKRNNVELKLINVK
tara:strand:+ start:8 stop:847 length:840 start_codon:yes stop_codon:yes gene_type:complete